MDAGLDSLGGVELCSDLESKIWHNVTEPSTLVSDDPTISATSHFIIFLLRPSCSVDVPLHLKADISREEAMAIVAMDARLASARAADDASRPVLLNGCNVDWQQIYYGDPKPQFDVFLEGVKQFDTTAFGFSHKEASTMDPQQRMLLQSTGCILSTTSTDSLDRSRVFVGVSSLDDDRLQLKYNGRQISDYRAISGAISVTSGRLSYTYRLRGPACTGDVACSSFHMAMLSSTTQRCPAAVNAGINIVL